MKILRSIIGDFDGFRVAGIRRLEHQWNAPIQVVIGANGYGKTRYMKACSPIPIPSSSFGAEGYRELSIAHEGDVIRLVSEYGGKSQAHSFYLNDGKNLNEGKTTTVQSELVQSYLGFTPLVADLVFNRISITSMTPTERRQCFMDLLPKTDFMLRQHKSIMSSIKSLKTLVAMLMSRKTDLESKILSADDFAALTQKYELLTQQAKEYLQVISRLEGMCASMRSRTTVEHLPPIEVSKQLDMLTGYRALIMREYGEHADDCHVAQIEERHRNAVLDQRRLADEITSTLDIITKASARMTQLTVTADRQELQSITTALSKLGETYLSSQDIPLTLSVLPRSEQVITAVITECSELIEGHVLPVDDLQALDTLLADEVNVQWRISELRSTVDHTAKAIAAMQERVSATPTAPDDCEIPACALRLLVSDAASRRRAELDDLTQRHAKAQSELDALTLRANDIKAMIARYRAYETICARTSDVLWELYPVPVETMATQLKDASGFIAKLRKLCRKASDTLTKEALERKRDVLTAQIRAQDQLGEVIADDLRYTIQTAEAKLAVLQADAKAADRQVARLIRLQRAVSMYATVKASILDMHAKSSTRIDVLIDQHTLEAGEAALQWCATNYQTTQVELSAVTHALTEQQGLKARLDDEVIPTLADKSEKLALCQAIEGIVSPSTGLPYDQMRTFLNYVFAQASALMGMVFTYPIALNQLEKGDPLTYKFYATVKNVALEDDIKECSDAQRAIIDLCMVLAIRKATKLTDYPLFLDEVGRQFDPTHKARLLYLLEHITLGGYATQLFVINHDAAVHGGLSHAETLSLSDTSVMLPAQGDYNQHVILTT